MKIIGYGLFIVGVWMMVSPQATLGLKELRWMAEYSFPGEALIGAIVCAYSLLLIGPLKSNSSEEEVN